MKKNSIKVLFTLLMIGLINISIKAQPINLGGGMVVATERPNLGFKIQGTYGMDFLLKNLRSSVNYTLFIPGTTKSIKYGRMDFDFDGQYSFYRISGFDFYAIGGLNITYYNTHWVDSGNTITSEFKPGINVGGGVHVGIGQKAKAFSEFKYIFKRYEQDNICFGVLFEL